MLLILNGDNMIDTHGVYDLKVEGVIYYRGYCCNRPLGDRLKEHIYSAQYPSKKEIENRDSSLNILEKDLAERHSSIKALEIELKTVRDELSKKSDENKNENRKLLNENRLLKSQLQALKEKSEFNEKYLESLKSDLKSQAEDKERVKFQLKDSEDKLVLQKIL